MGLLSSKSSTENIDKSTTVTSVDNRVTEADTAFVGGNQTVTASDVAGSVNVTTTDFGALDAASELADKSIQLTQTTTQKAQEFAGDVFGDALSGVKSIADKAVSVAKTASQDEGARTTQLLIIGGVGVIGLFLFFNRGK